MDHIKKNTTTKEELKLNTEQIQKLQYLIHENKNKKSLYNIESHISNLHKLINLKNNHLLLSKKLNEELVIKHPTNEYNSLIKKRYDDIYDNIKKERFSQIKALDNIYKYLTYKLQNNEYESTDEFDSIIQDRDSILKKIEDINSNINNIM